MINLLIILNLMTMTKYELPKLPYELDALEPQISRETMEYHYLKHHQAYITKLNELIEGTKYENLPLEEIILASDGPLFNNAAQAWNHTFFFLALSPSPKKAPEGELLAAIERAFGSFDNFRDEFIKAALTSSVRDGHGWWPTARASSLSGPHRTQATDDRRLHSPDDHRRMGARLLYRLHRTARPDFIPAAWDPHGLVGDRSALRRP